MANVVIALPNEGWLSVALFRAILQMTLDHHGHDIRFDDYSDKPIDSVRNQIVKNFLGDTWGEYLLSIDSDTVPLKNPMELVKHDLDIVNLPTPIWYSKIHVRDLGQNPIVWNCYKEKQDVDYGWSEWRGRRKGITEIDACGSGCFIVARRVLEKVKPAFKRVWDEDGIAIVGSDLLFCKRARAAGFRIWASWDHVCGHIKERDLAQLYQAMDWRDIKYANWTDVNTADYWDEQWRKRPQRKLPVYEPIIKLLRAKAQEWGRPISVLDFGCGRGDLLDEIKQSGLPVRKLAGMDLSPIAVRMCRGKGFRAWVGTRPKGQWDIIVSTEVLEHVEDDRALLRDFRDHSRCIIYSVPYDCLPPGLEREHRRIYDDGYIHAITPGLISSPQIEHYKLVHAEGAPKRWWRQALNFLKE